MKPKHELVLDILGIGFGPANIALAIALEESDSRNSVRFLERRSGPTWHPDMLLDGADIQNNPLRDFVTPRNPRSHYTFVNYLHNQGRLFDYLNLGLAFPLRKDYARYIERVARQFDAVVDYDTEVASIELRGAPSSYGGQCYEVSTKSGARHLARSLVVGIGRSPNIPDVFRPVLGPRVFHFTEYLARLRHGATNGRCPYRRICVVGGSQSSVEIVLDLMTRYPECEVVNVMRNYGYRQKDTSPFSEHVYFPEFVDYFFEASPASKARLWEELKYTNYSSADADVIHGLYLKLYEQKLDGRENVRMMPNRTVERVASAQDGIAIEVREVHTGAVDVMAFDAVVLATGFCNFGSGECREGYPSLLEGVVDRLRLTSDDVLHIGRDYDLEARNGADQIPPLYLNGLCESSHGFGDAGSFSLLSVRSETIARSVARRLNGNGSALSHRRENPAFARKGAAIGDAYSLRSDTRPIAGG